MAASASSTCSDIRKPAHLGAYNYHPPFPEPTHTVMPVPARIDGRRIAVAIDEEDQAHERSEEMARRGRLHAGLATFDVSDPAAIRPLWLFEVSELEFPVEPRKARASARTSSTRHDTARWSTRVVQPAGLRIVDLADPAAPREVGYFIPEPAAGQGCTAEQ